MPRSARDSAGSAWSRSNEASVYYRRQRWPGHMSIVSLHFRTFVHESEDEQKVIEAMHFATGLEEFDRDTTEGHHGNKIVILEGHIKDKKAVKAFFKRMSKEDIQVLLDTLENRVDEECFIFLRLDKQKAYLQELAMTTTDGRHRRAGQGAELSA